jgi:RNA:NAD 2'-phosphotransferase (TPT1/KptA family)
MLSSWEYTSIESICTFLKKTHRQLNYINRNHIIEFYFKDKVRKVSFKDEDSLKYEVKSFGQPSEIIHTEEITATLYNTESDLKSALITTVHLLRDNLAGLPRNKDGYYDINDICVTLKKRMPFLGYINRNHIIELFFKDKFRNIIFKDDIYLKYKIKVYMEPPEVLYFGTLTNLALKMKDKGIFSSTKRYIKLYTTIDGAKGFANKFLSNKDDTVSVIIIEAKKAYDKGLRFSTYCEGEFIVSEIRKEYIKEIL